METKLANAAASRSSRAANDQETLQLLERRLPLHRRTLHGGDAVYRAGERFADLHFVRSGLVKLVRVTDDGREQICGFGFKNDWFGFDGIAGGAYASDAVAMDTGEVWSVRYETLLSVGTSCPQLLNLLHAAMSQAMARERASLLSVCSLPADARVADFLRGWADELDGRGLRNDQITLRMTRAEIGSYLGMTLESVSRAFARLARDELISFPEKGRRELRIPSVAALAGFVEQAASPRAGLQ
jgi:CRP/FNR family transcriptional regulator, anaerobic regulatory protein